ncbi:MAG: MBL fold metallo-hydrolase, partial [Acidobacteria bacterium]|nr:MBL fold metallo-hydrolase [Acidobacteriota bacterium]
MSRALWIAATVCAALVAVERVETQDTQGAARQSAWAWKPPLHSVPAGEVEVLPVRGRVSMIVGAGGNITVHAGDDAVLLVDAGVEAMSARVLAAVRRISNRPIRYIVNTSEQIEHSGGNEPLADAGSTIPFRISTDPRVSDGRLGKDRANVISYLTVFHHMSAPTGQQASRPEGAWPDNTYSTPQKKLYLNDEPILIMHAPSNTDGNSIVHFRTSDVVSVGDLVDLTSYPPIDLKAGGSVQAVIESLNRLIDITVPNSKSEAGTLVIPGHGWLADQPDVVYYQQMVVI